eukprot:CAMPEP_0184368550 /NCGR_PEP_ID=MMETSP1089-20130417/161734_1 /TAXON_ID=38269 ORGANISM="Gloeochaete wittrockiana, Strain SAG46.84" /NCGR_SAMPLE_ID=MMETSP1089 /ASSEMBLY_ACC=CAM_ASM_000445 /LENGTH=307 /DNA_ID=CAMNT_0026710859 /DNA_START=29 /DNA_END=952 /DNA_ORIENTATION=-
MVNPKCESCGKTVYPLEAITVGEKTWHKPCFKCAEEGCGIRLNLKSYTIAGSGGTVYCNKHVPKDKPTAVTVEGSMSYSNAVNAPKVALVNSEKRGDSMEKPIGSTVEGDLHLTRAKEAHQHSRVLFNGEKLATPEAEHNLQVADMSLSNAINAPKIATVNDQVRAGAGERNAQVADMSMSNAINAPKVATINDQVRAGAGERNAQVADMSMSNAINAPKVATINDQVRAGAGERNAQVADMSLSNALNAPKVGTINEQVRAGAGERNAQVADMSLSNAINAPKLDTVNDQIKLKDDSKPTTPATLY